MIQPTHDELFKARKLAAKIVSLHGETYLPIFKRLHDELISAEQQQETKQLAIQIASQ